MEIEENQLDYLIDALTFDRNARLDILSAPSLEPRDHDTALKSLDITQKVNTIRTGWEDALQCVTSQSISRCVRDTLQLLEKLRDSEDKDLSSSVVQTTLEPLIDACGNPNLSVNERETIGNAYASLLPIALCSLLAEKEFTHDVLVVSVCRCSDTEVFRRLFAPYELDSLLSALEKELCYHFCAGRETTRLSEPQHFFTFLSGSFDRLQKLRIPPLFDHIHGAVEWRTVAHARVLWVAVFLIESVFQWRADSLLLESAPYVVLFLNAFFDFLEAVESKLCSENLYFIGKRVAFRQTIVVFLQVCLDTSLQALQQGPSKLWRRKFLSPSACVAVMPSYYAAVHAVRSMEAILRRLSSSSVMECITMAQVGPCLIQPFLEAFSAYINDRLEVTAEWTNLDTILYLADLFSSLHLTIGAANDWLLLLFQGERSARALASSSDAAAPPYNPRPAVMERLSTLQEQISSKCLALLTREVESLSHNLMEASPSSVGHCFASLELFLSRLSCFPCEVLCVLLLNKAKQTLHSLLPSDTRTFVIPHLMKLNMPHTVALFAV